MKGAKARGPGKLRRTKAVRCPRKFYTVRDDHAILEAFHRSGDATDTSTYAWLARRLRRTVDSLRTRYKKHLCELEKADRELIRRAAAAYPRYHVNIGSVKNQNVVESITWYSPAIRNRDPKVESASPRSDKMEKVLLKPQTVRRRKLRPANTAMFWLIKRLNNPDLRVARDQGVDLLRGVLTELVESGRVSREEVQNFVDGAKQSMTLKQIFEALMLRPSKKKK